MNNDYCELLLEKAAKECSNGHFYENTNWRQKVLNIFEKFNSVRQSQINIPATPEQEANSRERYSKTKDDLDITAESTIGNASKFSIFVSETQVDSSHRSTATPADKYDGLLNPGQKPYTDDVGPSNNLARPADNNNDQEQMSINPGQQPNVRDNDDLAPTMFYVRLKRPSNNYKEHELKQNIPPMQKPIAHDLEPMQQLSGCKLIVPPKPLSAVTGKFSNCEDLDAIYELNDNTVFFDMATHSVKPSNATTSSYAAASFSSDDKTLAKRGAAVSCQVHFDKTETSSDDDEDSKTNHLTKRYKMLAKKALNGHSSLATKSSIAVVPKKSSTALLNNACEAKSESEIQTTFQSDNNRSVRSKYKTKIMFTRVDTDQYMRLIAKLSFKVVDLPKDANVLVSNKVYRTYKFLSAIALGMPIISEEWLSEMKKRQHYVAYDDFCLRDKVSENRFKFDLKKSLAAARVKLLFANYSILVTANTRPPPTELETIILCAGGRCMHQLLDRPRHGDTVLAVSLEKDKHDWVAIREKFPNITIINTEGFMISIMQQCLNFSNYTLS